MPDRLIPPLWRREFAATLRLAGPLAAANLLQMAIYGVDVIFVARLGATTLAAASLAVTIQGLLLWAQAGMIGAVSALIAEEKGRSRHAVREVRRSVRMGLWLAVLAGLGGMTICLGAGPLMRMTGQDPEISAHALHFLAIIALSTIPMNIAAVLRNFVAAVGRPLFATMINAAMIGVQALGNYMLVFGKWGAPEMGLTGSGVATVITSIAFVIAYAIAIRMDRNLRRYRIWGNLWRAEWDRFAALLRIGVPVAVTIVAEAGIFSAAAFMMGAISPLALASHTLALQIASLAFQIPFGVGQAVTIRVGYFFGSGDRAGAGIAGWTGIAIGSGFMLVTASAMLLFPRLLLSIYVDVDAAANAAMIALALQFMIVAAAFQIVDGTQAVAMGALRGLQDTQIPMLYALFGYWVPGFMTALFLGFHTPLQGFGIWIGLAMGLLVVAMLLMIRWMRRERLGLLPV